MRQLYFVSAIACVLLSVVGAAQESNDSKQANQNPVLSISSDNWWSGTRKFAFNADGSFEFEIHGKAQGSELKGTGKLPPEQIERLISVLKDKGFFDITAESIERQIARDGGTKSRRTDQTTHRIEIQSEKLRNKIEYYDVYGDAQTFANATDLQHLKDSVEEIYKFLSRVTTFR